MQRVRRFAIFHGECLEQLHVLNVSRNRVLANRPPLTLEEFLPLMLAAAGAVGVAPFAVIRFANGDWLLGVLDAVIVISLGALANYVYRHRRVRIANIILAGLCIAGLLATTYIRGISQIFWAYPVMMAAFYLLKPREAISVAIFALAALLPAVVGELDTLPLTTIFITIWVTTAFAYAFAVLTTEQRAQLERQAKVDPLTGAGNRRALTDKLNRIVAADEAEQQKAALVMIDLDHFKAVNDSFGHALGDEVLVQVTRLLQTSVRNHDSVYRIGGEEFVVVSEGNGIDLASRLGEELRGLIANLKVVPDRRVTASLGIAELRNAENSIDDWLRRADDAMYTAKNSGRNRICVAE